jgi:hypothetical protein
VSGEESVGPRDQDLVSTKKSDPEDLRGPT